eukprot:78198_1
MELKTENNELKKCGFNKHQYLLIVGYIRSIEMAIKQTIQVIDVYALCFDYLLFSCRFCDEFINLKGSSLFYYFNNNNSNTSSMHSNTGAIHVCNKRTCKTLSAITCDKILDKCHHFCIGRKFHSECIQDCIHCNYDSAENTKTCPICLQLLTSAPTIKLEICGHFIHYFCLKQLLHKGHNIFYGTVWKSRPRYHRIYVSHLAFIHCPHDECNERIHHHFFSSTIAQIDSLLAEIANLGMEESTLQFSDKYNKHKIEYDRDIYWYINNYQYVLNNFEIYYCSRCGRVFMLRDNGTIRGCKCVSKIQFYFGQKIEGKWRNKKWYDATITKVYSDCVEITYDYDQQTEIIKNSQYLERIQVKLNNERNSN